MSAFAALQGQDAASILRLSQPEEDDDDGVLQYNPNSSDSEPDVDGGIESTKVYGTITPAEPSISVEPGFPTSGIWKSNFVPNEYNCKFNDDYVLIGLQESEYIMVMGQLKLTILSGAMLINQHHYYLANPSNSFPIIAPQSQAVPILSSTQIKNKSPTLDDNIQFLPKKFLTVIKLENMFTGLEQVGKYYPPFKRFFDVNSELDEPRRSPNKFSCYSFDVILEEKGVVGLSIGENWSQELNLLELQCTEEEPHIYMIIGSKNSGKSTFSKALLNQLLSNSNVSYLDMDPGQSEFSPPYSLTLTSIRKTILGFNTYLEDGSEDELKHYFGFTTPLHQPTLYVKLITHLFRHYLLVHKPKGNHLIINTPGWIKGYGKEILIELTKVINPTKLILLSSCLDANNVDNNDALQGLTFRNSMILSGVYQTSKYSPAQMRIFNKLIYFHSLSLHSYDFSSHILDSPPFKISYETTKSANDFLGVNAVTFINYEVGTDFSFDDIFVMIDASIFAMYLVENELFHSCKTAFPIPESDNAPFYLSFETYRDIVTADDVHYKGLCMVHSINRQENYLNLYLPKLNQSKVKEMMLKGYKLLLVKGDGEIPSCEFLNPAVLKVHERQLRQTRGNKNITPSRLPYISINGKSKLGGVWKVRRNVMRRGHQR